MTRYLILNCLFTGYRIKKAILSSLVCKTKFQFHYLFIICLWFQKNNYFENRHGMLSYLLCTRFFFQNWRLLELFNLFEIWVTVEGLKIHAPLTLLPRDSRSFTFDSDPVSLQNYGGRRSWPNSRRSTTTQNTAHKNNDWNKDSGRLTAADPWLGSPLVRMMAMGSTKKTRPPKRIAI
jgi:hypothetical protein